MTSPDSSGPPELQPESPPDPDAESSSGERDALVGWHEMSLLAKSLLVVLGVAVTWQLVPEWDRPAYQDDLPEARSPVTVVEADSRQDFQVALSRHLSRSLTDRVRCQRLALLRLGLVKSMSPSVDARFASGEDSDGGILALSRRHSSARGFYAHRTDSIVLLNAPEYLRRHEYLHALEDQYTNRMEQLADARTTDRMLALKAVIEGTAQFKSGRVETSLGGFPRSGEASFDLLARAFVYSRGHAYVKEQAGGSLRAAWELRPRTTFEMVHGWRPNLDAGFQQPTLADGEAVACTDRLGALGVRAALLRSGAQSSMSQPVGSVWAGDRVYVLEGSDGISRVIWTVAFRDEEVSKLWQQDVKPALERRDSAVTVRARVVGQE